MKRISARAFLGVAILASLGNIPRCNRQPATLECEEARVTVLPDTCVLLVNPCADHQWQDPWLDELMLSFSHGDGFVRIQQNRDSESGLQRFVCADPATPAWRDRPIAYEYQREQAYGYGQLLVTTRTAPVLTVSAAPGNILPGGASQLGVVAEGGAPPYTYLWEPSAGLTAANVANPVASPSVTTSYTVTVSDSLGLFTTAVVTVDVRSNATASAVPNRVDPYGASQLSVTVEGGVPPYAYAWLPAESLDDPISATPTAFPEFTTTYQVTVTDSLGRQYQGSTTVVVNLRVDVQGIPNLVNSGNQVYLFAFPSGGLPPYAFLWAPAGTIDNPTVNEPIARPTEETFYQVTVTDSLGASASGFTHVNVIKPTTEGPVASLAFVFDGVETVALDATASTGSIVSYQWDFSWSPNDPDVVTTTPSAEWFATSETCGVIRLTVVDEFNRTSTVEVSFPDADSCGTIAPK